MCLALIKSKPEFMLVPHFIAGPALSMQTNARFKLHGMPFTALEVIIMLSSFMACCTAISSYLITMPQVSQVIIAAHYSFKDSFVSDTKLFYLSANMFSSIEHIISEVYDCICVNETHVALLLLCEKDAC